MDAKQQSLFSDGAYERIEQALDAAIMACGGRKKFARELWPEKPVRDAHNLIDACLNPDRRERFTPHQVVYILRRAKEVGFHAAKYFIDKECGYEPSPPTDPQVEEDRVVNAISEAAQILAQSLKQLETFQARKASPNTPVVPLSLAK